ncbi:MAG: hypothetical protein GX175_09140 [Halanaerobiaceae bacterium]|jgi:hypothetical protein|nr:hypothetical protein [Halanaerobiaceae bacterium]
MEKYQKKVHKRSICLLVSTILLALTYLALLFFKDSLPVLPDFNKGFQLGIFLTLEIIQIYSLIQHLKALRDKDALRKMYINENDERNILIMQKSGNWGLLICLLGLGFATIIASFFNQIVFFTLLGALFFISLVRGVLKIYYHHKY